MLICHEKIYKIVNLKTDRLDKQRAIVDAGEFNNGRGQMLYISNTLVAIEMKVPN